MKNDINIGDIVIYNGELDADGDSYDIPAGTVMEATDVSADCIYPIECRINPPECDSFHDVFNISALIKLEDLSELEQEIYGVKASTKSKSAKKRKTRVQKP